MNSNFIYVYALCMYLILERKAILLVNYLIVNNYYFKD